MSHFAVINNIHPEIPDLSVVESILIQIEYTDSKKFRISQHYGLDLVRELRTKHGFKNPICVYSPLPERYFQYMLDEDPVKYAAFNDPAVIFRQQPVEPKELEKAFKKINPITDAGLADVCEMLYNRSGYVIDKLTHDLKYQSDLTKIRNEFKDLFNDQELTQIDFEARYSDLIKAQKKDEVAFLKFKSVFINICVNAMSSKLIDNPEKLELEKKYTIVMVEDDPLYMDELKKRLGPYFNLKPCTTSAKAINTLSRDTSNNILAVVSDWRLYEEGGKKWQNKQGYDVLAESAKKGFYSRFALTSLNDKNVHQIRNRMSIEFELVKKDYLLTDDDWENLILKLNQACEDILEILGSIPDGAKEWIKYRDEYLCKRSTTNWSSYESEITSQANGVIHDFLRLEAKQSLYYLHYIGEFGGLDNLLVLRRIAFALWFKNSDTNKDRQLKRETETPWLVFQKMNSFHDKLNNNNKNGFFRKLCILANNIHACILPEEKVWLKGHGLLD